MRNILSLFFLVSTATSLFSQFNVSYHQSNLPFIGIGYEFKERYRPEIRLGTDLFVEDVSIEGVFVFDILEKDNYELYGGLGARYNMNNGIVVPIGFNFYPFQSRNFGFHMELAPILDRDSIVRGSWGIRYSFEN